MHLHFSTWKSKILRIDQIYLTFHIPEMYFIIYFEYFWEVNPVEFCIMYCMNVLNNATLLVFESTIKLANGTWDV